jgi:hypothetical protein
MSFIPIHVSPYELVQYYVRLYYREVRDHPRKVADEEGQLEVLDRLNEGYKETLAMSYCEWDNEENRVRFEKCMDFLTQAFSKRVKRKEAYRKRDKLMKDVEERRKRHAALARERLIREGIIKEDS